MSKKVYIATRLENAVGHNRVRDALVAQGHTLTYDWSVHGSVQHCGTSRIQQVALNELQGVRDADLVVVLLPGGRGTHVELGIALAGTGKDVLIAADPVHGFFAQDERTCAFYHHPVVQRFESESALIGRCARYVQEHFVCGGDSEAT